MLTLWNPLLPVTNGRADSRMSTKNYFDRLFEDTFATMTQDLIGNQWSIVGIERKKNEDGSLAVSIDVPGIKEENINIEIIDNMIYVKGERKTNTSSYVVNRSLSIPEGYSSDDIKAELIDGVLTLTLATKQLPEKVVKKIPLSNANKQLSE